ncbi:MAG: ThiF family adenylyltransferase [archaeon]
MIDYSRQKIFDMQSIGSAKITMVGAGLLGEYLGMYMAGFGIKNLKIIDGKGAGQLEQKLLKINPGMRISTRTTADEMSLGRPEVLIEATNNKNTKEYCKNYAKRNKIRLINIASDENNASINMENGTQEDFSFYDKKQQGSFTSGIIAAIALDETRKIIMPMQDDQKLRKRIDFSMHKPNRFNQGTEQTRDYETGLGGMALVVGAGGIGTHLAINLARMGIGEMDIMDGDKIENHNLNRQILYYERIGKNKAETLAERLVGTRTRINALPHYLKHESQIRKRYDIIFSCVDNWEWRIRLSRYAKRNNTPLINGAVTTFTTKTEFSNCLECKYGRNVETKNEKRAGCNSLESNVVMQNAFAGALMASEAKAIAMPQRYTKLQGKEIRYNTKNSDERKIIILGQYCTCKVKR